MKQHLLYGVVLALFLPYIAPAQRMLGVSTDNWSSTRQLYLNPAAIADQKNKFTVDLFSVNAGFDNNLAGIMPGKAVNQFTSGDSVNVGDFLSFSGRDKFNMMAPSIEIRGPGALVRLHKNHTIALTTRIRAANQLQGFSQKFYRSLTDVDFSKEENSYALSTGKFDWTVHMWSEIGLSYAATVWNSGPHRLKAGGTIRYLGGIGYLNINCKNVDVSYFGGRDSIQVTHTNIAVSSNMVNDDDIISGMSNGDFVNRFFESGGSGIGGDIGMIYEYAGETAGSGPTDYLFRVSASVVDIGRIKYRNDNEIAYLRGHGSLNTREISDRVTNFSQFKQYVRERGVDVDTSTAVTTVMQLPTSLILGADYFIRKSIYINTLFIGSLVNRYEPGVSAYNQLTVTPRYETKLLTVAVPITYSSLTGNLKAGLGVRVSGFFFGSDDLPVFGSRKYGFNFYFGACVPFYRKNA